MNVMNNENEKKTKELELGQDTTSNTEGNKTQETKSTGRIVDENNPNSFYDGGSNKSDSAWTEDWRGKTLIFLILLLLLIGIAIPSGMAAAGYFKDGAKVPNFTSEEQELQVKKDIQHMMDIAVIDNYDAMVAQGYVSQKYADNKLEDIENDIEDQIQEEKDTLKDTYGKTWEDEWSKELFNKGFDTEEEYKNSLRASKLKDEQVSSYTSTSLYTAKAEDSLGATYVSGWDRNGKVTYVNNDAGILAENDVESYDEEDYEDGEYINIISPEDLTWLYVNAYEPLAFNSTTIELTTIGADGETTIKPDSISVSKENLQKIRHLGNSLKNGTLLPQNKIEGSIQSRSNINLGSSAANAAIYAYLASSKAENKGGLFDYATTMTGKYLESDINSMTTTELEAEADTILALPYFLNDGTRSLYYTETIGTPVDGTIDYNNATYVSYLDTDGIHYIGLAGEGEQLVTDFLDKKNRSVDSDYNKIPDLGYLDSFKSFVTANAETIILLNQIYDFDAGTFDLKAFNEEKIGKMLEEINKGTTVEEKYQTKTEDIINAVPYYINKFNSKQFSASYYGVIDYAKDNRTVFAYDTIKTSPELIAATQDFALYHLVNDAAAAGTKNNKTLKRGDQYE